MFSFIALLHHSPIVAPIAIATFSALDSPEQGRVPHVMQHVFTVMNRYRILLVLLQSSVIEILYLLAVKRPQQEIPANGQEET